MTGIISNKAFLIKFWAKRTTPSPLITDPVERSKVQLLLSIQIILSLAAYALTIFSIFFFKPPQIAVWEDSDLITTFVSGLMLTGLYFLGRTKYYKISMFVTLALISIVEFIAAIPNYRPTEAYILTYLFLPILFSSLLLPNNVTIALTVCLVSLTVVYWFVFPFLSIIDVISGITSFLAVSTALIIFTAYYRNTLEKERQAELREKEERYRLLFENNPIAAWVYELETHAVLAVNNAATTQYGYTEAEFRMLTVADLNPFITMANFEEYNKIIHSAEVVKRTRRQQKKDGTLFEVETTSIPIEFAGKRARLVMAIDITERRRTEAEQQRLQKLESLGLLAGGIAHDFNNILMALTGSITIARLEVDENSEAAEILGEAERAAFRARDLTSQLLTFAKGGAPVKNPTNLKGLLEESANFALRGSKTRCHFNIKDDLWWANIDSGQISQVIHNLIINADQAMPLGGKITITAQNVSTLNLEISSLLALGEYVKIVVQDEGHGIPAENLSRIFDPYFTTKQKGNGLGLAMAFSIVTKHGGLITVDSVVGKGSCFTLYLPAVEQTQLSKKLPVKGEIKPANTLKILVLDDDKAIRLTLNRMLAKKGYTVIAVEEGTKAVEAYQEALLKGSPFDLVILDLTIPGGLGGKEVMSQLHTIDPEVLGIVSSGYSHDPVMANYKEFGFSGTLSKPYQLNTLYDEIDLLMHLRVLDRA
jgi:two-component system, cell cycle sensor histidine kinase and response regulator CckA